MINETDTVQLCEALVRHCELAGAEVFEKNYIKDHRVVASVVCCVGEDAEEFIALIRNWAQNKGMNNFRQLGIGF